MFIRCRPYSSTKKAVTICESRREGKKVIQHVVKYLGIAHDEKQLRAMKALAKAEIARLEKERKKTKIVKDRHQEPRVVHSPIENLLEKERIIEGFHDIFSPIFNTLNLGEVFSEIRTNQLKDLVIARIASPSSKLRTAELLKRDYAKQVSENQIYKLMDVVTQKEEEIHSRYLKQPRKEALTKELMCCFLM